MKTKARNWGVLLQQSPELLNCEAGILHDSTHRDRVDRICPGNRQDPDAVAHHDVLPLASDFEASLLERPHGILVVYAGDLRHG